MLLTRDGLKKQGLFPGTFARLSGFRMKTTGSRWRTAASGKPFLFALVLGMFAVSAAAQKPAADTHTAKYLGPGSCSAVACHGGIQPMNVTPILQNEYSIWVVKDKHAKAWSVLQNPVSQRMAAILGIGKAQDAPKCLACHALAVSPAQKGRDFDVNEGVSCESCHGPSSAWLGPHTLKGSTNAQNIALGMFDTKDIIHRAENCLTCHVGTAEKNVDHEMIAAGHPDLVFELDAYLAVEPPHWKPNPDPLNGVRVWSVGQAVQLSESLKRLSRRANGSVWPEYAELDCISCHHSLTKPEESWRQSLGYHDRRPGNPPYNDSHYVVFRALVKDMDASTSKDLETQLDTVYRETTKLNGDRKEIAAAADRAASISSSMAQRLNKMEFDRAATLRLMHAICADADHISAQGVRSAEQATMALDSALIAYSKSAGNQPETRSAVDALFQQLENPSSYNAPKFAAAMKRVNSALR
jgi:hypothetical protein